MWSVEQISLARGLSWTILIALVIFTYLVLRLIEVRHVHFLQKQAEMGIDIDNDTVTNYQNVEKEDTINFREIEHTFFEMERSERPSLGVKANIHLTIQALATVLFSCHTSSILPIALIGIIFSTVIVFLCLWRKQLKYPWMSELANHHLRGTLLFVICTTTSVVTMFIATFEQDEEIFYDYIQVMRFIGCFSTILGGSLFVVWIVKRFYITKESRNSKSTLIEEEHVSL